MTFSRILRFSIASLLSAVLIVSDRAAVQSETCYFINSAGKRVSLGGLCGDTLSPAAPANPSGKRSNGVVSAKIKRRISATPVIEVTFNGNRKFDMIVDTGASGTLITRQMAQALQVSTIGSIQAGIADGSVVNLPVAQMPSISVNRLTARNVKVAIADRMEIGLLGHDFFGDYDIKIKRDVVEFYPR